jgi:hypothetical protein
MKLIPIKKLRNSIFGVMIGISIGFGYEEYYGIGTWHSFETPTQSLSVCFYSSFRMWELDRKRSNDGSK